MSRIIKDITSHIENFRYALSSLVDSFDRASILYLNSEQGDDFDIVSEAMFRAFVICPLIDMNLLNESHLSFSYGMEKIDNNLIITSNSNQQYGVFRQFLTRKIPFDYILVSEETNMKSSIEYAALGSEYFLATSD